MDLISHRITQFNDLINKYMKDDLTLEKAQTLIAFCNAQHKWVGTAIAVYQINKQGNLNTKKIKALENKNIFDENTAIDLGLGDPEIDKVKCPEHDNLITRSECLDYSGAHHEECSGCEIGKATKEKLLPIK